MNIMRKIKEAITKAFERLIGLNKFMKMERNARWEYMEKQNKKMEKIHVGLAIIFIVLGLIQFTLGRFISGNLDILIAFWLLLLADSRKSEFDAMKLNKEILDLHEKFSEHIKEVIGDLSKELEKEKKKNARLTKKYAN